MIVCAKNSAGNFSPPSNLVSIQTGSGGNASTITLDDIAWPAGAWTGHVVFGGTDPRSLCAQLEVDGPLPSSITLTDDFLRSTWTVPSAKHSHIRVKAKRVIHSGPAAALVTAVDHHQIVCSDLADLREPPEDDWTGRVISVIADASDGSAQLWNFLVTGWDPAAGVFSLDPNGPDPVAETPADSVEVGDVLTIRAAPSGIQDDVTIEDLGFQNVTAPAGLTPDAEVGNLVRILSGTGAGQVRRISANSAVALSVDTPWETIPDQTSVFLVEAPAWEYISETGPAKTTLANLTTEIQVPVDNLLDQVVLATAVIVDADGHESEETLSPMRETYLFGAGSALSVIRDFWVHFLIPDEEIAIGSDVMDTPYRVRIPEGTAVVLDEFAPQVLTAPEGADLIVDILVSSDNGQTWASLSPSGDANKIVVPDGQTDGPVVSSFAISLLQRDDLLRLDVLQVGATVAGGGLEVVGKGRVVAV